jgi:hypothetical protein
VSHVPHASATPTIWPPNAGDAYVNPRLETGLSPYRGALQLGLVPALLVLGAACSAKSVDRMMLHKPIRVALTADDLGAGCTAAEANLSMAASIAGRPPAKALTILEMTAAVCTELQIWEAELYKERLRRNVSTPSDLEALKDAQQIEMRLRTEAARRDWRAYEHAETYYGAFDGTCPKLGRDEELPFLLGLFAASSALLYDQSGGGQVGVPTSTLRMVADAAACLDDAEWWSLPSALQAGAWIMVPGTVPAGVDPWQALEEAAVRGDATTIRAVRGMQIVLAHNAGRDDVIRHAIERVAAGDTAPDRDQEFLFLDAYSRRLALHYSDLIWTRATGHRTPTLGTFPDDETTPGDDGLQADPFADDPFAEPDAAPPLENP